MKEMNEMNQRKYLDLSIQSVLKCKYRGFYVKCEFICVNLVENALYLFIYLLLLNKYFARIT